MKRAPVGLVATVREPGPAIATWVRHHLAVGFDRLYLFFDDPTDPSMAHVPDDERVEVVPCDEALRACWLAWPELAGFVGTDVMARQLLNAEVALQLARAAGLAWLAHLDADELLDDCEDIGVFLAGAAASGAEQVVFQNLEAVPEVLDPVDVFRDVTLFKRNPTALPGGRLDEAQAQLARRAGFPERVFLYYRNGKAAVRLLPGILPSGCHLFRRREGHLETRTVATPRVLHYANAGFAGFWHRYSMWGDFPDRWLGRTSIRASLGDFHLEARDVVRAGDRDAARAFYRERVVLGDPALVDALVDGGVCERITPAGRHTILPQNVAV
jgi:hypothetical protein